MSATQSLSSSTTPPPPPTLPCSSPQFPDFWNDLSEEDVAGHDNSIVMTDSIGMIVEGSSDVVVAGSSDDISTAITNDKSSTAAGGRSSRRRKQQDVIVVREKVVRGDSGSVGSVGGVGGVGRKQGGRKYLSKHFPQTKKGVLPANATATAMLLGNGKKLVDRRQKKKRMKIEMDVEDVGSECVPEQVVMLTHDLVLGGSKEKEKENETGNELKHSTLTGSPVGRVEVHQQQQTLIQSTPPTPPPPRIFYGLNVDELSSDSELSECPSDLGPDPFLPSPPLPTTTTREVIATKVKKHSTSTSKTKSPYFPNPSHKHRTHFLSTILPFPPLHHRRFGLMQERLAQDPFRLLLATIFLNKTPGQRAMPVFFQLMARYPTPEALSRAQVEDVTEMIRCLGFQNQRARKCVALARGWVECPPQKGRRYAKVGYPCKGDGRGLKVGEWICDEDDDDDDDDEGVDMDGWGRDGVEDDGSNDNTSDNGSGGESKKKKKKKKKTKERKKKQTPSHSRVAWEISHLPGLGPYSHDSWRMFCRDELRGKARDWLGTGASASPQSISRSSSIDSPPPTEFEPEWKRVLPLDKELRAWMTWMWLKEGWVWNKETGQRTKADDELMELARKGGVVQEEEGAECLVLRNLGSVGIATEDDLGRIDINVDGDRENNRKYLGGNDTANVVIERLAGDFMPG